MKVGIMQPYFFPYMGYWQLMHAVDQYVIYDDVNYIKKGWINRNRILLNGEEKFINVQLLSASQNKKINQIIVAKDEVYVTKNLRMIESAYKKAPYFDSVFPLLEDFMKNNYEIPVSIYLKNSFELINHYLEKPKQLLLSSELSKDNSLKGEDKILAICKLLNATEYYNAIGGIDLYSSEKFKDNKIKLCFLKQNQIIYKQFSNKSIENLSIIDVLMFNSKKMVKEYLEDYSIILNNI